MVATPIGNMGDMSPRAVETLRGVSTIFAEDTRVTGRLLSACGVKTTVRRYDHHSHARTAPMALSMLREGRDIAYVTDAGTPGVEDPGGRLVAAVVAEGVRVVPIPGPSAVMAALSVCGFPADRFTVMGFPPKKKGRELFLDLTAEMKGTVVVYESVHRIQKTVEALAGRAPDRSAMIARELTKLHEEILRGTLAEIVAALRQATHKGEYVIVLGR